MKPTGQKNNCNKVSARNLTRRARNVPAAKRRTQKILAENNLDEYDFVTINSSKVSDEMERSGIDECIQVLKALKKVTKTHQKELANLDKFYTAKLKECELKLDHWMNKAKSYQDMVRDLQVTNDKLAASIDLLDPRFVE
jgi:hypothetical protein